MEPNSFEGRCYRSTRANGAVSVLVSLVIHLAILLLMACWVYVVGGPTQGMILIGQNDPAHESPTFQLTRATAVAEPNESPDVPLSLLSQPETLDLQWTIDPSKLDTGQEHSTLSNEVALASTILRARSDAANSEPAEDGREGQGASFFGAYAPGGRFVYILDSSASMEGERWMLARSKLIQSLRLLGPDGEFFLICFDHQTSLMFDCLPSQAQFHKADEATIRKLENWLRYRMLGASTMPAEALSFGIQMKPDAIFFLSDGELRDHSLSMLRKVNSRRNDRQQVPIHAVHLISPMGKATLEQIAKDNGGTFTFVPEQGRPHWRR